MTFTLPYNLGERGLRVYYTRKFLLCFRQKKRGSSFTKVAWKGQQSGSRGDVDQRRLLAEYGQIYINKTLAEYTLIHRLKLKIYGSDLALL